MKCDLGIFPADIFASHVFKTYGRTQKFRPSGRNSPWNMPIINPASGFLFQTVAKERMD